MKTTPSSTRCDKCKHEIEDGLTYCRFEFCPCDDHKAAPKRSDEIARNVAREIQFGKVPQGDVDAVTRALDYKRTEYLAGLISQAYAPLYEQKEELVRVLRNMTAATKRLHKSYGYCTFPEDCATHKQISEAEAALEKAQK